MSKKIFRCKEFLSNGREEKLHNFFKYYQQGGRLVSENKPIKKTFFDSDSQKYLITFNEHRDYYDFYHFSESISECYLSVRE